VNRKLRTALIVVGVVIVALLVIPFLIPANQFRPTIEEQASTALGRKVTLGNLSVSLLAGSLSAQNLSIADDPGFSSTPFLTAKSLKVGVKLIPLIFSKRLDVTGVTIKSPRVVLLRNAAGQWNYSSLGHAAGEANPVEPAAAKPSSAPANVSVNKLRLSDGQVIVGTTSSQARSTYDDVNVTASGVSMTSNFPFVVTSQLPGGGNFRLDGNVGPIDSADASLTPLHAKLRISSLNIAATGWVDPSLGLGGLFDLNASMSSQNGEAETDGAATLSKALLVAGGSPASEPLRVDFKTTYDLRKNAGVLEPSKVELGNATANLNGSYETTAQATVLSIKVEGQNMPVKDLQAFLPAMGINIPKGTALQAGSLNTNLNLNGPTAKLVTTGNVGLFGAKLAGFDLGSKMSGISSLAGAKTGKDLELEKLTSDVRMAPDGLTLQNFVAVVPGLGSLVGGGVIDSKNNLNFRMAAELSNSLGGAGTPVASGMGMLAKFTGSSKCKGGLTVPFRVEGTTSDPKFTPDVSGAAASFAKSQLGCLGGAASGAAKGQTPANAVGGFMRLLGKKKH
jgi:AsmA protein